MIALPLVRIGPGAIARRAPGYANAIILALVVFGSSLFAAHAADGGSKSSHVLVLYANNRLLPANIEGDRGLTQALASAPLPIDVSAEFLDYPRFGGEGYVRTVSTYLRDKYRERPPDVVVAGGEEALEFILSNRPQLFQGVPVVFMGVGKALTDTLKLPSDVYGVPVEYDPVGTITHALLWHPAAKRLVVVTGTSNEDLYWEKRLRGELTQFKGRVDDIQFVSGVATADLRERLRTLAKDAIVFTPGYFLDGAGREFAPREAAREIAAAAPVPVYGP